MRGNLEITTTIPCRLMCTYCPQALLMKRYSKDNDKFMSMNTLQSCLSSVPKDISVSFSGYAECFLNPNCADMICWVYDQDYKINLYTTLVGLKETDIDRLNEVKFEVVALHLPDMEGHMKTKIDDEYLTVAQKFSDKIGNTSALCYGTLDPRLREIFPNTKARPSHGLHARADNVQTEKIEVEHTPRLSGKIRCDVATRHGLDEIRIGVLLPNGDVQLCCQDYGRKHILGNLLRDSYDDLFLSEEYLKVKRGLDDDSQDILCRTCIEARNG